MSRNYLKHWRIFAIFFGRTYTVSLGETLDTDATVVDIQPKQVTLEKAGVQRTLHLNTTSLLK